MGPGMERPTGEKGRSQGHRVVSGRTTTPGSQLSLCLLASEPALCWWGWYHS